MGTQKSSTPKSTDPKRNGALAKLTQDGLNCWKLADAGEKKNSVRCERKHITFPLKDPPFNYVSLRRVNAQAAWMHLEIRSGTLLPFCQRSPLSRCKSVMRRQVVCLTTT